MSKKQTDMQLKAIDSHAQLLTIHSRPEAEQPFAYSVGRYGSRFLAEIRDNGKFVGVRCPKCKKVYVPPREVCGPCFCRMTEPVEVGPQGKLITFSILRIPFIDPETGEQKPVPFGYGHIRLDGANTNLQHYFTIEDESRVKIGARMEAVFKEKKDRRGTVLDIKHFQVID